MELDKYSENFYEFKKNEMNSLQIRGAKSALHTVEYSVFGKTYEELN